MTFLSKILFVILLSGCVSSQIQVKEFAGQVKLVSGHWLLTNKNGDFWAIDKFKAKIGDSTWLVGNIKDTNIAKNILQVNGKNYQLK